MSAPPLAVAALLLATAPAWAQTPSGGLPSPTSHATQAVAVPYARPPHAAADERLFDPALAPFYHGVASGDPLPDGAILWTRVTPDGDAPAEEVAVRWHVATDPSMGDVVLEGETTTGPSRDYTVKVDARGLDAGTTYYYTFTALGRTSLVGRTRTAPTGADGRLRFAVVSCSNYPAGFFNAYARIADRADLDAVFHLGDYLYEYGAGTYGADRPVEPETEIVSLDDYRIRHSLYKLDPDLRAAHQQHPFITVWDDHESANDAWETGAQNHQPADEGDWADRKAAAKRAYFEWMPIRDRPDAAGQIYRRLAYGDLADVFMIDTRLEGRQQPLAPKGGALGGDIDTTAWFDEARTLLGAEQYPWLTDGLAASTAQWKVIGNQVMMMNLAPHPALPPDQTFTNLDAWDGYPAERARLLNFLLSNGIDDVVVMTGDIHSSWAADLPPSPFTGYDPATGEGSVAVEFVTTSVTSSTFFEGVLAVFQQQDPTLTPEQVRAQLDLLIGAAYPQIKNFEPAQRGYYVLDLSPERAQADWFYVDITAPNEEEVEGAHWATAAGANHLVAQDAAAPPKPNPPTLAPGAPPGTTAAEPLLDAPADLLVIGSYPNPAHDRAHLHYVLNRAQHVRVAVYDLLGREAMVLADGVQAPDVYRLSFSVSALPSATYFYRVTTGGRTLSRTLLVQR